VPDQNATESVGEVTEASDGDEDSETSWIWIFLLKSVPDLVSIILLNDVYPR
jgi:hypothetical protein